MNPIFAQALAPWTPPPAPTKTDLVTRALIMALTAPDAARAQECADIENSIALSDLETAAFTARELIVASEGVTLERTPASWRK